jgi:hypothetical protein
MDFPVQLLLLTTAIGLLIAWLAQRVSRQLQHFNSLQQLGIPVFATRPFLGGHLFDVMRNRGISYHIKLLSTLGSISGHYFGGLRTILIANYSVIREVCIGRSSEFPNRSTYFRDLVAEPEEFLAHSLINVRDAKWKRQRATLSPTFTDSKLDQLRPMMMDRVFEMLNIIREGQNRAILFPPIDLFNRIFLAPNQMAASRNR